MRHTLALLFAAVVGITGASTANAGFLYGFDRSTPSILQIDPTTGATLATAPVTMPGFTVLTNNVGMATDPTTGTMYALLRVLGQSGRQLATIDPVTGIATSIGNTGNGLGMSSIAFNSAGVLYGVTGDGGTPSETLHTINTTTGAAASVLTLGNGADGEVIAFNPVDGLMYHASGNGTPIFESINLGTLTTSSIPLSGTPGNEVLGLVWDPTSGTFLGSNLSGNWFSRTTGGVQTTLGAQPGLLRGFAFTLDPVSAVPAPAAVWMGLAGVGVLGVLRRRFAKA